MPPAAGANRRQVAELKGRTSKVSRFVSERSARRGPLTPERSSRKRKPLRASETPARASGPIGKKHAARPRASKRQPSKAVVVEQGG
jgi:hypothetical protein